MSVECRAVGVVLALALMTAAVALSGCNPPPVITQAQVAAKKTPAKHPQLTDKMRDNCAGCHRVVATKSK